MLESPAGSRLAPGSSLGSVPRKIVLDQPGTWLLQGRFQGRLSPAVAITIPGDRQLIVTIPTTEPEQR